MTKIDDLIEGTRDVFSASRVYGDPYEKDGVTFIPAAAIRGGGGAGEGDGGETAPTGSGGGFGMIARPVGAYQIRDGEVTWIPAADTTRVIIMAEVVVMVGILAVRSILKKRRAK